MRKIIDGDVRIDNLCLTELFDLSDVEVTGVFSCRNNTLTSLIGSPHTVGQDFWCENNELTNLIGAPHTVIGFFDCGAGILALTSSTSFSWITSTALARSSSV